MRAPAAPGGVSEPAATTLRAGRSTDVEAVLALWRDAEVVPGHGDELAGLDALLARDPGALILAEEGGALVGAVIAGWDGWRGTVYRLAVAPGRRRSGLGTRLVRAAEERLRGLGAHRLQAIVIASDPQAAAFWRGRPGWEEQADRRRFVSG